MDTPPVVPQGLRCKAGGCQIQHAAHHCKMCGDTDANHTSPFCYVFCTPKKAVETGWRCKAIGCHKKGCNAHLCTSCNDADATHIALNCPNSTTQTCRVASCKSNHKKHGCCVCAKKDVSHRSYECPDPGDKSILTAYHQTKEKAAACIMASREMKKGSGGVCGPGIYFATSPEMTRGKAHHFGFMIVARIYLGKRLVVQRQDLSLNGSIVNGKGYDSVHCIRNPKKRHYDEYVIYSWARASIVDMYPCDHLGNFRPVLLVKNNLKPAAPKVADVPVAQTAPVVADPAPQKPADPVVVADPPVAQVDPQPAALASPAPITVVIPPAIAASTMTVFKSNLASQEFFEASNFVYQTYLKKRYKDAPNKMEWHGTTVYRPNHGLAHSMRCAAYIPLLCGLSGLKMSQSEVDKTQIAMMFYVAGRESEVGWSRDPVVYQQYRTASSKIYLDYAEKKGWSDRQRFARALKNPHAKQYDPVRIALAMGHELDMLRCKFKEPYEVLVREKVATLFGTKKKPLGKPILDQLVGAAVSACKATGDKVYKSKRDKAKFAHVSTDVKACVDVLVALNL